MAKWTSDDPDYHRHVVDCADRIVNGILDRGELPTVQLLESWHKQIYRPVAAKPEWAGHIRQVNPQYPTLNGDVFVTDSSGIRRFGVPASAVRTRLTEHCEQLQAKVHALEAEWQALSGADQLKRVAALVAWEHGEFIRIHPFPDGNGRIARLLCNCLLGRFGIPYTVSVKPRPSGDYNAMAEQSRNFPKWRRSNWLWRGLESRYSSFVLPKRRSNSGKCNAIL